MTRPYLLPVVRAFLAGDASPSDLQACVDAIDLFHGRDPMPSVRRCRGPHLHRKDQTEEGVPLWLVGIRDRLGIVSDRVLSAEADISISAIGTWRRRLGIGTASQALPGWVEKIEDRLGLVSDHALAVEVGVQPHKVRKLRRERGLPPVPIVRGPPPPPLWLEGIRDRLGHVPDTDLAREVGRTHQRISQLRQDLGIDLDDHARSMVQARQEEQRAQYPEELIALLGVENDCTLAARSGLSISSIHRIRSLRGIPPALRKSRSKISPFEALLGTLSDEEIARKAGCTPSSVFSYRTKRGIPSMKSKRRGPTRSEGKG